MLLTELDLAIDVGRHLEAVGAVWCIKTRGSQLDREYMEPHAAAAGLTELLARLLAQQ